MGRRTGLGRGRTGPRTGAGPAPDRASDAGREINLSRTPPRTPGRAGRSFSGRAPDGAGLGPGRRNSRRTPDGAQRTAPDATPDGENVPDGPGRATQRTSVLFNGPPWTGLGRRTFRRTPPDGRSRTAPDATLDGPHGLSGRYGRWGPLRVPAAESKVYRCATLSQAPQARHTRSPYLESCASTLIVRLGRWVPRKKVLIYCLIYDLRPLLVMLPSRRRPVWTIC